MTKKLSTQQFVFISKEVHGDKYDYSYTVYTNSRTPINIICPIHGKFSQTPFNHLNSSGCKMCANERRKSWCIKNLTSNEEEFISKSIKIHGMKYDYSVVDYNGALVKVKIKCPKHGEFEQTPANHLFGKGCPNCSNNISKQEISFLDYIGVKDRNKRFPNWTMKPVDGYDPMTNTIYEFLGDYWHGNPVRFNPSNIHPKNGISFGQLYKETFITLNKLKSLGYTVKYIWESEWNRFKRGIDPIPNIITL